MEQEEKDELQRAKDDVEAMMKEKYPKIGAIFIFTGQKMQVKTENGEQVAGFEFLQGSNLPNGLTCACLSEALRGRIENLPAFQEFAQKMMSGGNA